MPSEVEFKIVKSIVSWTHLKAFFVWNTPEYRRHKQTVIIDQNRICTQMQIEMYQLEKCSWIDIVHWTSISSLKTRGWPIKLTEESRWDDQLFLFTQNRFWCGLIPHTQEKYWSCSAIYSKSIISVTFCSSVWSNKWWPRQNRVLRVGYCFELQGGCFLGWKLCWEMLNILLNPVFQSLGSGTYIHTGKKIHKQPNFCLVGTRKNCKGDVKCLCIFLFFSNQSFILIPI